MQKLILCELSGRCLPAVYADGGICLDILQNQWSPIYDVSAILTSIQVRRGLHFSVAPMAVLGGLRAC